MILKHESAQPKAKLYVVDAMSMHNTLLSISLTMQTILPDSVSKALT
jgi:hypothetical protein